ncbi:Hypothetical predicted protein [Paramuricea clavata]|uniref:Uncharacterized protein n=1 Tax=Paramuricea clavata TaxID=317549 RepID=A0A6S7JYW5_PARCT|nr:Hypothetical predicted protein [Paramuricea clavata]
MFRHFLILLVTQLLFLAVIAESADQVRKRRALSTQGTSGSCQGLPGLPGRDGRDGRDAMLIGPPGKRGAPGPTGTQGVKGNSGGVVYTRWGRSDCPQSGNTTMLYSGVMGGSYFTHTGGASNYLCLPLNPIFDKIISGFQGYSYMYGTEYELGAHSNMFPQNLYNHDAPCAVCYTESRSSHLMIPARNVCPSGWTLEYKGYLMSAYYGHTGRTQFTCVDGNAEGTTGSQSGQDGALLYFVESQCGSLPCPPYANGKELTCVVCTK